MKKIAFGFLTLMMLFGGVFLSACGEKKISLSVSSNEVTISTNGQQTYQDIVVTLNESGDGINVQVESQNDVVSVTTPTRSSQNEYTFRATALKSGQSRIRVSSIEDASVYETINVQVDTMLEGMTLSEDLINEKGQSELFVVKNSVEGKDLTFSNYFNIYPLDANVKDIAWTFQENNETTILRNEQVVAEIVDNQTLFVYEDYNSSEITLLASFVQMPSVQEEITFQVINDSTIEEFYLGNSEEDRILVRNDPNQSRVSGRIVVDTFDENMTMDIVVYRKYQNGSIYFLPEKDYEDYFSLDQVVYNYENGKRVIDFTIDAQVVEGRKKLSGDVYVAFNLEYKQYAYGVSTAESYDDYLKISTYFVADTILVRDETTSSIADKTIDLYSNYVTTNGYKVLATLSPDDVVLSDNTYQIAIDNMDRDPNYYINIYRENDYVNYLSFTRYEDSSTWLSEPIESGTSIYLRASSLGEYGSQTNFPLRFVATSNGTATETVYANLYQVTDNAILDIYELTVDEATGEVSENEFAFDQVYYISSSDNSMTRDFNLRIKGFSSSTGLDLVYNRNNFDISFKEVGRNEDKTNVENSYVDILVTVNVLKEGYSGGLNFSFTHKTGAKSEAISIFAFAPLESAQVVNNSIGSNNVFYDETTSQSFVVTGEGADTVVTQNPNHTTNGTLSKLLMSAGTHISLNLEYDNATLNSNEEMAGYQFMFMDFDAFNEVNQMNLDYIDKSDEEKQEIFENLNPYIDAYNYNFSSNENTYFTYSDGKLKVNDSEFVVYVAVIFYGFDEEHNEFNLMRIFKLESFYPVTSLRSNISDVTLYSFESISSNDDRSQVKVSVNLRLDKEKPTYNDLSNFSISLRNGILSVRNTDEELIERDDNGNILSVGLTRETIIENDFVTLTGFSLVKYDQTSTGENVIEFNIQTKSTQFNLSWVEIVNLNYQLEYNGTIVSDLSTNINIDILRADRVENITWVNRTENSEVYLNIATNDVTEQFFTISTSVSPNYAENRNLTYFYQPHDEDSSVLNIETNLISQSFNLTIGNSAKGGYGYLYILPEDMVKIVGGVRQIVYYTVGDNGELDKTAKYLNFSQIDTYYESLLDGTYVNEDGEVAGNYFLNNDNEKIYYSDIILRIMVIVADGQSEETAIRVYTEEDLKNMQSNLYYRVMNSLELDGWTSIENFSGMVFGHTDDVTLTFTNNSQTFINNLTGTVKDLIMVGDVTGGGFVANYVLDNGVVDNITVDVNYLENNYAPSTLKGGVYVGDKYYAGGIAGENRGTISNSKVYGLEIDLVQGGNYLNTVAGGIAGNNYGKIDACGVEFYNFIRDVENEAGEVTQEEYTNKFTAEIVGGLVGNGSFVEQGNATTKYTQISNSYVYAYSLLTDNGVDVSTFDGSITNVLNGQGDNVMVGAFVGTLQTSDNSNTYFKLTNSFAYVGQHTIDNNFGIGSVSGSGRREYKNSYISYLSVVEGDTNTYQIQMDYILSGQSGGTSFAKETIVYGESVDYSDFDGSVWEIAEIDEQVNFGFAYLKNVHQNVFVSVDQTIQNVEGKMINADAESENGSVKAGIFFLYEVQENLANDGAKSELERKNTINITELFGITENEAKSLLLSVDRINYIDFTTSSLTAKRNNLNLGETIKLTLHSRVDFSQAMTYEIMVVNYVPEVVLSVDESVLGEGQILNIQTGQNNQKRVQVVLDHSIYLGGQEYTLVNDNEYAYSASLDEIKNIDEKGEKYVTEIVSENGVNFIAKSATKENIEALIRIELKKLASYENFSVALSDYRQKNFYISTYLGANSVSVFEKELNISPLEPANFKVVINSDSQDEDLALTFTYNGKDYFVEGGKLVINDNLVLDVEWEMKENGNEKTFNVYMNVNKEYRHKVDKTYNFVIGVNAKSQKNNKTYLKTIDFSVKKQGIDKVNVTAYTIESRIINNSRWYYTPSTTISSTLVPGSDSILAMDVSPIFAHFSRIDVLYDVTSNGNIGTVQISRLSYNSTYGYYIDSSTTTNISTASVSGLRITPTDNDLQNGIYYFRINVSSSFSSNSSINLTFNFYDEDELVASDSYSYIIDYLNSATILVNGQSSVMVAKGESVEVSISLELNQSLTNNSIRLEGAGDYITLSDIEETVSNSTRNYKATINTSVLSTLQDGNSTGVFYVYASVSRYVNGVMDYIESYATIYLLDFTLNENGTKIVGSTQQVQYGNGTYDSFVSYINAEQTLAFSYVLDPEEYNFDSSNVNEYNAVYGENGLMAKQTEFMRNGSYRDDVGGYFINYEYDSGIYREVPIEERLLIIGTDDSETPIYNSQTGEFLENEIVEFSSGANSTVKIKGLRIGSIHMRLETIVISGNKTFTLLYDFVITINVWSDEEVPVPIYTAEEFLRYAEGNRDDNGNTSSGDYILMNDIVLQNYTPLDTTFLKSLDGNGYQIYIDSFNTNVDGTSLNIALFDEVVEGTTLKNVRVNIYNGGQLTVNIRDYQNVNIAGFALTNNGIIYNCEVVAYYDENLSSSKISSSTGLVVNFVKGTGTDNVYLTSQDVEAGDINIVGFVVENNNIITNSRVGGESVGIIVEIDETKYYSELSLPLFTIRGQGTVNGFVQSNSGTISASFVNNVQIENLMNSTSSVTSGFVNNNSGEVHTSYVQGANFADDFYFDASSIVSTGRVAGFVYNNTGLVKNSYVNIAFEVDATKSYLSAGFVYQNSEVAEVLLCYAAAKMTNSDINEMSFSGVNERGQDLNLNEDGIRYSYYYSKERVDKTPQGSYDTGAFAITDVAYEESYYRFSFSSTDGAYDGIWTMTNKNKNENDDGTKVITLVSANHIAFSNREIIYNGGDSDDYYYLPTQLTDINTYRVLDFANGSINNPIIIRSAADFAKATGKAQETEISSYKQYYTNTTVFGTYRLVNDLDFSEIDQDVTGDNNIILTTTTKSFLGILDGNSFTISNISLGASTQVDNYGLFRELKDATIMNVDFKVTSVHNANANIVGALAGTAVNTRLIGLSLSPNDDRVDDESVQAISILGNNIVGGVVGIVIGDSKLNDITVTDIDVASRYYDNSKTITYNDRYTGDTLRELIYNGSSLGSAVKYLSYAGGIAGYVDIYKYIGDDYVQYSTQTDLTDYNVVSIKALDSVDIYGEVAGGLFGYLGKSLMAYDLGIELDADMALNNPSYITSKNLFAGGIVGESYAGLYAVYAKYSTTLQKTIEEGMYNYYNGGTSERGQLSIFSYTALDTKHPGYYNNPLYIGGIVGYAKAGYVTIAYNKLNVVSNVKNNEINYQTEAVGGIVGYINSEYRYDSDFINNKVSISYYLNQTYFSGVIYSENTADAGGIIGQVNVDSDIALNKVNSIPYYDASRSLENVYSLIAGFRNDSEEDNREFPNNLYLLDSRNGYHNVVNNAQSSVFGNTRMSVAVTNQFLVDAKTTEEVTSDNTETYIKGQTTKETLATISNGYVPILEIESIKNLATIEAQHSSMSSFFLHNDWDETRWEHEADEIFPDIVLYPKLEVLFLDADERSIADVLAQISTDRPNATVVVRGRVNQDSPASGYSDVDLRTYLKKNPDISLKEFGGTFVSYSNYMNSSDEGILTEVVYQNIGNNTINVIGGDAGDEVGLILSANDVLFDSTAEGFTLDGINIYVANEDSESAGTGESDLSTLELDGPIITEKLENANIIDVTVFFNGDLNYTLESSEGNGVLANVAKSSSFQNINFVFRYKSENNNQKNPQMNLNVKATTGGSSSRKFGLIVGESEQSSVYSLNTISNVYLSSEPTQTMGNIVDQSENIKLEVKITNDNRISTSGTGSLNKNSLYFGFLVGNVFVNSGASSLPLNFGMTNLTDDTISGINMILEGAENQNAEESGYGEVYLGGYFGNANLTEVTIVSTGSTPMSSLIRNFNIVQKVNIEELNLGLGFGTLTGQGQMTVAYSTPSGLDITGGLYQIVGVTTGIGQNENGVNIGSFAGASRFNINLSTILNVEFEVLGDQPNEIVLHNEFTSSETQVDIDVYDKQTDPSQEGEDGTVSGENPNRSVSGIYSAYEFGHPSDDNTNEVNNNVWVAKGDKQTAVETYKTNAETNIGTFIGLMNAGTFSFSQITFSELSDVQIKNENKNETNAKTVNVGAIGKVSGGSMTMANSTAKYNATNYFVETDGTANVGGLIGNGTLTNFNVGSYMYGGTVVSFAKTINFGGLAGNVELKASGLLQEIVYGGTLKNFIKEDDKTIVAGGVIGTIKNSGYLNIGSSSGNIKGAYSYGDVFVNYDDEQDENNEGKIIKRTLDKIAFGGVIGEVVAGNEGNGKEGNNGALYILKSYSLATLYNDRLPKGGLNAAQYANNAFVGMNSDLVNIGGNNAENYYSSGVTLSYQYMENNRNIDVSYGFNDDNYYGYSSNEISGNASENNTLNGKISSDDGSGIVEVMREMVGKYNSDIKFDLGSKLNPIEINNSTSFAGISSSDDIKHMKMKYYYISKDFETSNRIEGELNNVVIVGNGKTITLNSTQDPEKSGVTGGTTMGLFENIGTAPDSYTAISGIVVDMDFNFVINKNDENSEDPLTFAGLVNNAGMSEDNAGTDRSIIIYAVGATGSVEFGGKGYVDFAGLVGNMYTGMLSNSYVDLDIFYHAGYGLDDGNYYPKSTIKAVFGTGDGIVDVFNTFANGQVKSYVPSNIYTFNSASEESGNIQITNSYSVMQVVTEDYGYGVAYNIDNFQGNISLSYYSDYSGNIGTKTTATTQANGKTIYTTTKETGGGTKALVNQLSIGFNDENKVMQKINISKGDIYSQWFYSPFRNNGYGTTGFVYLRNTTAYSRVQTGISDDVIQTSDGDKSKAYRTYEYAKLSEEELATLNSRDGTVNGNERDYFLAITNVGKFSQIQDLESSGSGLTITGNSFQNCKFFLRYDINLSDLGNNGDDAWNYINNDLGTDSQIVVIDGQDHLVEFENSAGLFGTVYANIENLRIINHKEFSTNNKEFSTPNGKSSYLYGVLAGAYTGSLINVSVQGDISVNVEKNPGLYYIGGVAGQFTGTMSSVESIVTISADYGAGIVGGVVGQFTGENDNGRDYGLKETTFANAQEQTGENNSSEETTNVNVSIINGEITYTSFNGSIVMKNSNISANVTHNTQIINETDVYYKVDKKNLTTTGLTIETTHTSNTSSSEDDSTGKDISNAGEKPKYSGELNAVAGGIAGYVESGNIEYSYNNATIMNQYYGTVTQSSSFAIRNLASGGIVGYQKEGSVDNSINTGYIVSGNNRNEGVALSGGIVGYSKGSVSNSINDAKVQSVSYVDPSYYNINLDKSKGLTAGGDKIKFVITIEYNITTTIVENASGGQEKDPEYEMPRLVHAYGIGYFNSQSQKTADDQSNANLDAEETINDGNIGYTVRKIEPERTAQHYGGGSSLPTGTLDDYQESYDYYVGEGETQDIRVSAYDAYGFPSRLNYYYEYNLTIQGFKHNYSNDYGEFLGFSISDNTPNTTSGDARASKMSNVDYNDLYPGGTTSYYFSLPFYSTETDTNGENYNNGNSYDELVEDASGRNSNISATGNNLDESALKEKYNEINEYREKEEDEKSINVAGEIYNYVNSGDEFIQYTGGIALSGRAQITLPTYSYRDELGENVDNDIQMIPRAVASIKFKLLGNDGNGWKDLGIQAMGANTEIMKDGDLYYLDYEAYFNKTELQALAGKDIGYNSLQLTADYTLTYEVQQSITLTKRNMEKFNINKGEDGVDYGIQIKMVMEQGNAYNCYSLGGFLQDFGYAQYYQSFIPYGENESPLAFNVNFTNNESGEVYYLNNKGVLTQGNGLDDENATKLLLWYNGSNESELSSYIGLINLGQNSATKRDSLLEELGNKYTMNLTFYAQGSGEFDNIIGGATEFASEQTMSKTFASHILSSNAATSDYPEGFVWYDAVEIVNDTNNNMATVKIYASTIDKANPSEIDVTMTVTNQSGGNVNTTFEFVKGESGYTIENATGTISNFATYEVTITDTTFTFTFTRSESSSNPPQVVDNSVVITYYDNSVTFNKTELVGLELSMGDTPVQGKYEYDGTGVYVENEQGKLESAGEGEYTISTSGNNIIVTKNASGAVTQTVYLKYTFDGISEGTTGTFQIVSGSGGKVVYINTEGFYYTLESDEDGYPTDKLAENEDGKNYTEMQDTITLEDGSTLSTRYQFYKISGVNSYRGVTLNSSNSYIITQYSMGNAKVYKIVQENQEKVIATIYNLRESNANEVEVGAVSYWEDGEGVDYVVKDNKYYISTYAVVGENGVREFESESKWEDVTKQYGDLEQYFQFAGLISVSYQEENDQVDYGFNFQYLVNLTSSDLVGFDYEFNEVTGVIETPVDGHYSELNETRTNLGEGKVTQNTFSINSDGTFKIQGETYVIYEKSLTINLGSLVNVPNIEYEQRGDSPDIVDVIKDGEKVGYIKVNYNEAGDKITGGTIYYSNGNAVSGSSVEATYDEEGNLTSIKYNGIEKIIGTVESTESEYIRYVIRSKSDYTTINGKETSKYHEIVIDIPFTSISSVLYEKNSLLVANSISANSDSSYAANTASVRFTDDSLRSYIGKEVEFASSNYGPSEREQENALSYGSSSIDYTFDLKVPAENAYVNITSSNSDFELEDTEVDDDKKDDNTIYKTISIDTTKTSVPFGEHEGDVLFEFGIQNSNQEEYEITSDVADGDADKIDLSNVKDGNIIINSNIYVDDMSITIGMEVRGYDHIVTQKISLSTFDYAVKVSSSGKSSGKLQDTNFAIMGDAKDRGLYKSGQNVFLVESSGAKDIRVKDIEFYGSLRQIDPITNAQKTSQGESSGTITAIMATGNVSNITSNLSMIGKDGESADSVTESTLKSSGESVNVLLQAYEDNIITNKSIIVSGNGGNGSNGADGVRSEIGSSKVKGENGVNAGDGGTFGGINNNEKGITINGADGTAGNGGNGADGLNATKKTEGVYSQSGDSYNYKSDKTGGLAGGGGAGGNSGETNKKPGQTNRQYKDLPGSGGTGGLGMYYTSSSNYEEEYMQNISDYSTDGNATGYSGAKLIQSNYSSWIKTSGGGGTAGDCEDTDTESGTAGDCEDTDTESGANGKFVTASASHYLRRGYNVYRENKTSTPGYYWNYKYGNQGGERLFGNLQMTSTFSYYGTTPEDTGPWDRESKYIPESSVKDYYYQENAALAAMNIGIMVIMGGLKSLPWGVIAVGLGAIDVVIAAGFLAAKNTGMVWGERDVDFFASNDDDKGFWDGILEDLGGNAQMIIDIITTLGGFDYTEKPTVFEGGTEYFSDGGINDYWWLYSEKNKKNNGKVSDFADAFNNYLNGINNNRYYNRGWNKNPWEDNFYGGAGGGDGSGTKGNGGTSYTKEIYGYSRQDEGNIMLNYDVSTTNGYKCFFTRNDMVTSAGIYGDAGKGGTTSGLSQLNNII